MVEHINSWAQKIIVVVIICTILEMILPEGKNKKYIKVVMGIYIVFTIISPIINRLNKSNLNLDFNFIEQNKSTVTVLKTIDTNKYIEEIYIDKIKDDIKEKLQAINYCASKINLKIETKDEKAYGTILSIEVVIDKKSKSINDIKINKVSIDNNISEKENVSKEEVNTIKKYLTQNYNITEDRIEVR